MDITRCKVRIPIKDRVSHRFRHVPAGTSSHIPCVVVGIGDTAIDSDAGGGGPVGDAGVGMGAGVEANVRAGMGAGSGAGVGAEVETGAGSGAEAVTMGTCIYVYYGNAVGRHLAAFINTTKGSSR